MTVKQCKKILGKKSLNYSDEYLTKLIHILSKIAELDVENYLYITKDQLIKEDKI